MPSRSEGRGRFEQRPRQANNRRRRRRDAHHQGTNEEDSSHRIPSSQDECFISSPHPLFFARTGARDSYGGGNAGSAHCGGPRTSLFPTERVAAAPPQEDEDSRTASFSGSAHRRRRGGRGAGVAMEGVRADPSASSAASSSSLQSSSSVAAAAAVGEGIGAAAAAVLHSPLIEMPAAQQEVHVEERAQQPPKGSRGDGPPSSPLHLLSVMATRARRFRLLFHRFRQMRSALPNKRGRRDKRKVRPPSVEAMVVTQCLYDVKMMGRCRRRRPRSGGGRSSIGSGKSMLSEPTRDT